MATNFTSVSCVEGFLIPPGYRFRPSNEDVLFHYLLPAIHHHQLPCNVIRPLEIYGKDKEPWKLFEEKAEEPFWVFTKLKKKSQSRNDRVAGCGSWEGQNSVFIEDFAGKKIGENKYFTFKCNDKTSTPRGRWMMHEYSHNDYDYAICKIQYKDVKNKRRRRNSSHSDSDSAVPAKRVCSDQLRSNGGTFETDPEGFTCTNGYIKSNHSASSSQQVPPEQAWYAVSNSNMNNTEENGEKISVSQQSRFWPNQQSIGIGNGNGNGNDNSKGNGNGNGDDNANGGNLVPILYQQTHQPQIPNAFVNSTASSFQPHPSTQSSYIMSTHSASSFLQVPPAQACYFSHPNCNMQSHQNICPDQQGNGNGDGDDNGGNLIPSPCQQTHQVQIQNALMNSTAFYSQPQPSTQNSYNLESNTYESNAVARTDEQSWTDEQWVTYLCEVLELEEQLQFQA